MDIKRNTILAISVGTRTMGVAVMRNKQLIDWQTKSFKSAWSDEKFQHIMSTIEGYMDMHGAILLVQQKFLSGRTKDKIAPSGKTSRLKKSTKKVANGYPQTISMTRIY